LPLLITRAKPQIKPLLPIHPAIMRRWTGAVASPWRGRPRLGSYLRHRIKRKKTNQWSVAQMAGGPDEPPRSPNICMDGPVAGGFRSADMHCRSSRAARNPHRCFRGAYAHAT
jgi:hypothetical protein